MPMVTNDIASVDSSGTRKLMVISARSTRRVLLRLTQNLYRGTVSALLPLSTPKVIFFHYLNFIGKLSRRNNPSARGGICNCTHVGSRVDCQK